jgi:coenzyme F420-0:L-glutamate ligase/coenzyme F420-1:gamma-L-glutamate ligase
VSTTAAPLESEIRILGLPGIPEIDPGTDLVDIIGDALDRSQLRPEPNDVLVVTQKIVSKAEGRLVALDGIEPSPFARQVAERYDKDARQVEIVLREAARIVRMDHGVIIAETKHGFVCANAGVDASNVAPGVVCLLPIDPDASAARIRAGLGTRFGLSEGEQPGVIISDSFGRPWRRGIINVAIGVAGLAPLTDYRGYHDPAGYELSVTVPAVADELASAAELAMHKLDARPVALVRGYRPAVEAESGTARDLVMDPARDLFR